MNQVDNNNVAVTAQYLADKGYSITRAAQNVGCSPAHLTRVLQGDREPSAALLERLHGDEPGAGVEYLLPEGCGEGREPCGG